MPGAKAEVGRLQSLARDGVPVGQCTSTSKKKLARGDDDPRCSNPAILGGTVCPFHGGSAPQVREAARRRLLDLVPDAIEAMALLAGIAEGDIVVKDEVRQRALADILDRAGLRPVDQVVLTEQSLPNEQLDSAIARAMEQRGMLPDGIEEAEIVPDD